jgi:hypothetical protein
MTENGIRAARREKPFSVIGEQACKEGQVSGLTGRVNRMKGAYIGVWTPTHCCVTLGNSWITLLPSV